MSKQATTVRTTPSNGAAVPTSSKPGKLNGIITELKPSPDDIRRRAYELYCQRTAKGIRGDAAADWLAAERELTKKP